MPFSMSQISGVNKLFSSAEELVGRFFRLSTDEVRANRYEVGTLATLQRHELTDSAFAHLCKYYYQKAADEKDPSNFHFYRICLQDDRILDAVKRAGSFIKLAPLMLYIATHELVHIIRFNRGDSDFDVSTKAKMLEERRVDSITREILKPAADTDMTLVMDCFSSKYKIDTLYFNES